MRSVVRGKAWLFACAFFLCGFGGALRSDDSPVTGALPDTIDLYLNPQAVLSPADNTAISLSFCNSQVTVTTPVSTSNLCVTASRAVKTAGHKTDAVQLEPNVPGEWRFSSDYWLTFTPKGRWHAGTDYKVTFKPGLFPPEVRLRENSYSFKSQQFYLSSKTLNYLQDPSDPAKKLVTVTLDFNYPIARASLQKGLSFTLEGSQKPLAFTVAYDEHDTRANITVPVEKLTASAQFIDMALAGTVKTADGTATLQSHTALKGELGGRVMLPSLFDYLQISSSSAKVLKNAHYVPQQMLVLETNAGVNPADISRFVEVHLLPEDKPVPGLSPKKDYVWASPIEVTPEMRKGLPVVSYTSPSESGEPSLINALDFSAEGGRYLLVTVKKGLPAQGGYQLGKDYEAIVAVPGLPREVKVMAEGALLSLSGEKTLSVMSLGVSKLEYEIGRVKEEDISHLISQTGGNFAHPYFYSSSFNQDNLSHVYRKEQELSGMDPKKPDFSSFDFSPYLDDGKGLFFLTIRSKEKEGEEAGTPHHHRHHNEDGQARPGEPVTDQRFILLTDLGLIVKENADGTRDVFVQSISDGGPESRVNIEVLGLNGEPVATARTDGDGHAQLPNLDAFKDEKKPVAFVARKGDDLSFLPYDRHDRELNYSRFDVSGNTSTEGMQAYLFTDRGIYRPGETAHIGMIIKARDWTKTEGGLPLVLEITNPHGQVVNKQTLHLTDDGLIAADYTSSETSATGVYDAAIYLGRDDGEKGVQLGDVPLRVEEFQPDKMKMTSTLAQGGHEIQGMAWVKPDDLQADVTLMQLYGAPAKARKVTAKLALAPGAFGFETYKEYKFAPEGSVTKTFEETLPETATDDNGKAHFPLNLDKYKASTFRLTFLGEGFEPDSGRSVKTAKSVLVSPLDYVLGTKADGNFDYISPGDARSLSLIAVDSSLKKIPVPDLSVELKKIKDIQSLTRDERGNYTYQSTKAETSVKTDKISIPADGLTYALPTQDPGSYALVYKNAAGVMLSRVTFTVVGEGNASAGFTRDATMQVTPDKASYAAGDNITLNIQSPYTGTGLITIETDKVHAWQWFTTDKTSSTQTIRIPDGFEGKGFINVQFTRDLKSKEIFMSPLSFAVVPFVAGIDAHDQKITLSAPKDIKPGDTVTVQYQTRRPGKVILYAVDEGILLYAHYKNPDPIDYFLMKRGLEVKTSQIMDLLLPEYSLLRELSAAGGDGFANDGKNLNPFRRKTQPPVAYWSGILDSGPDEKSWTFTVPSYFNGGVRILAVSAAPEAIGTAEAGLSVHGPLIVTPNLPLFAAPGDTFTATVTVANHVKGSGKDAKVRLDIESTGQMQVLDAPKEPVAIAENGEQTIAIKLKATDALGSGTLRMNAALNDAKFTTEETISIRPPLPSFTSLISGYAKETSMQVAQPRILFPELAEMKASVSSLPVSLIGGLREYLVTYPYGCTEQMTSQNFPNVVLYGNAELIKAFGWKPEQMETAIRQSFDQLRERQNAAGGWGMWNYYSEPHEFISTYVMHFLLEAKEKNLPVPADVFDTGLRYMKQFANEVPTTLENAREKAYAIYILTRAGEITTNYIPHLTQYLDTEYRNSWHDDLAAVYLAATYEQMQMHPEAEDLLNRFHLEAPVKYTTSWHDYAFYDSLTKYSQYLYLIAHHFPKRLETMDKSVIWRVANFVGEGSYDTLSSSYAVMAINAYVAARTDALAHVTIQAAGPDGKEQKLTVTGEQLKVASLEAPASAFTFGSDSPGFFYQVASSGFDKTLPEKPLEAGLELTRNYVGADGKPVTSVKLGDTVDVVFTLRSGSNETIGNVALVDLLPGGFELMPAIKPAADASQDANAPADDASDPGQPADAPQADAPKNDAAAANKPDALPAWQPAATDRREDRIILYGSFAPEVATYRYRMKATSRGTFVIPPSYAQSMYDSTLKVRGTAGSIEVK